MRITGTFFAVFALAFGVACQGLPGEATTSEPVADEVVDDLAEEGPADGVPTRGSVEQYGAFAGLANTWEREFAGQYRDSGWAGRTETIVNSLVEEGGGEIRSPLVCKTNLCRGTFWFPHPEQQNEVLMGIGLSAQLGFPFQSLIQAVPNSADIVFYLRKESPAPKSRSTSKRPPPPTYPEP
jgi:hypothetical protein